MAESQSDSIFFSQEPNEVTTPRSFLGKYEHSHHTNTESPSMLISSTKGSEPSSGIEGNRRSGSNKKKRSASESNLELTDVDNQKYISNSTSAEKTTHSCDLNDSDNCGSGFKDLFCDLRKMVNSHSGNNSIPHDFDQMCTIVPAAGGSFSGYEPKCGDNYNVECYYNYMCKCTDSNVLSPVFNAFGSKCSCRSEYFTNGLQPALELLNDDTNGEIPLECLCRSDPTLNDASVNENICKFNESSESFPLDPSVNATNGTNDYGEFHELLQKLPIYEGNCTSPFNGAYRLNCTISAVEDGTAWGDCSYHAGPFSFENNITCNSSKGISKRSVSKGLTPTTPLNTVPGSGIVTENSVQGASPNRYSRSVTSIDISGSPGIAIGLSCIMTLGLLVIACLIINYMKKKKIKGKDKNKYVQFDSVNNSRL